MVNAAEALDQVKRVAMRMAYLINPRFIVKSDRVDDQSISLISPDRVAHPSGVRIFGVLLVQRDEPPNAGVLVQDVHNIGSLNEYELVRITVEARDARRVAILLDRVGHVVEGGARAKRRPRSLHLLLGPRRHRHLFRLFAGRIHWVPTHRAAFSQPISGQIRHCSSRRRRRRLAGSGPRRSLSVQEARGGQRRQQQCVATRADREVLYLFDVAGFKTDEIGAMLGVRGSAVRQRLSRARERFRLLYGAEA